MDRVMGVLTLKAPVYKEIAEDPNATTPAAIIVALATLVSGFFGGLVTIDPQTQAVSVSIGGAVLGAILGVIFGLIGWWFAAWVTAVVAGWFNGKTDTGEMMRVSGYAQVFSFISVLNVLVIASPFLACLVAPLSLIVAVLAIIGNVLGIREAAEFSTGNAVITAIIAGIVRFIIQVVIVGGILAALLVALGLAGAVMGG